ncbi:unnamed protein product [Symbiodinium sp. CCMP2592]|nr:unnamed protein product [Symbiodinium sp. CCMP2592]
MSLAGSFATLLLGLWITGAVRPSREDFQQLLEAEAAPPDVLPIAEAEDSKHRNLELGLREAGAAFLEGGSADYPHCDGLPRNGSHVIDTARILNSSCTWHGHPGLQVTLKEPLIFQGNLTLMGEIQIVGEQELDGPCINVSGKMTVLAAHASFVGCRNGIEEGKGGALFILKDFIVGNSHVQFESCAASSGGGLYTEGSFSLEAQSTVSFDNCTSTSASAAFWDL